MKKNNLIKMEDSFELNCMLKKYEFINSISPGDIIILTNSNIVFKVMYCKIGKCGNEKYRHITLVANDDYDRCIYIEYKSNTEWEIEECFPDMRRRIYLEDEEYWKHIFDWISF